MLYIDQFNDVYKLDSLSCSVTVLIAAKDERYVYAFPIEMVLAIIAHSSRAKPLFEKLKALCH